MKLLRLRLKNLNSIRQEVTLDFENGPLSETALFAITGQTGAGKSTLLDALSVALFHKTPRLDGSSSKNPENLLSQGSTEGFAEVTFQVNQKRYLAEWQVKRTRTNKTQSSVKLLNLETGQLLNDKKNLNPVPEILGLDFNAFRRSVLLAQGEFAAFLKASSDDKRKLLENVTGIDLFVTLSDILNDQRKTVRDEFENQQKILERLPQIDAASIQNSEAELAQIQEQIKSTQVQRQLARAAREKEAQRLNNWKLLKQTEAQLEQLQRQESDIKSRENELGLARKAAALVPVAQLFDSEQKNLTENQTVLETTLHDSKKIQFEQAEQEEVVKQSENDFEKERTASKEKFERIDLAAQEEVQASALREESRKRKAELALTQNERATILKVIQEKQQALKTADEKIQISEKQIAGLVVPENHTQLLGELNQKLTSRQSKQDRKNELENLGKKKNFEFTQLQQQQQQISDSNQKFLKEKEILTARKNTAETEWKLVLQQGDEPQLEARRKSAQELQELALNFEADSLAKIQLEKQLQQFQENCRQFEAQIQSLQKAVKENQAQINLLKEKTGRLEAEEKNSALSEYVFQLRRDHLKVSEPCPVCGSPEHPWATRLEHVTDVTLNTLRLEIETAKSEFEERQQAVQTQMQEEARQTATLNQVRVNLAEAKNKISELEKSLASRANQWPADLNQGAISSQFLKSEVVFCEQQISCVRQTRKNLEEIDRGLMELAPKISAGEAELKNLKSQIAVAEEDLKILRQDFIKVRDEFIQLENEIRQKLPVEYQKAGLEPGTRQMEENVQLLIKTERAIAQLNQNLTQNKTELENRTRQMSECEKRVQTLEEEIAALDQQAQSLVQQAQAKTGGLPAKEARLRLEQKLQELEQKKNQTRQILQARREASARINSKLEELNQRQEKIRQNFGIAQQNYLGEIRQSGFGSIDQHRQALRQQEWFQKQEQVVDSFRKELFSVQQEIKRLSAEFEQGDFTAEDLERLEHAETELEQKIESLNTGMGTLREKIKQMLSDLEIYRSQEQAVTQSKIEFERWQNLFELIGTNKLRDYALKSMFHVLIRFANQQMNHLTSRYILKVKEMRELAVVDTWNAGEERPVETLSGGESFLTSLALALALSELSKGRAQLESLFLDEGFGSLDQETLDLALDALEGLRLSGRKVGVISHVQELTRRIPVRIAVKKKGDGSSTVAVEGRI